MTTLTESQRSAVHKTMGPEAGAGNVGNAETKESQ
jgi:hypothetical protein